jgi:hypothetical protein
MDGTPVSHLESRALHRAAPAVTAAAVLLFAACSSSEPCEPASPAAACPDLKFRGHVYTEWREVDPLPILQEVGDATYPECNDAEMCDAPDLDGFGGTDVWLLEGADLTDAVIGLREGTHTYVIFVRVGVDPEGLLAR